MAKLILGSVLCIFLLVKGIEAGEVAAGESCDGSATTCKDTDYCENDVCKIKVAQTCVSGSSPHNCILHAECPTSGDNLNKCTCDNDYTANTLETVCEANAGVECDANTPCVSTATCDTTCKVNVGATGCSADLPCVTGATCEGGTCKIKVAQTCVSGSSPHNCILHAECPDSGDNLNKCTCENDYTANTLKTVCEANAGEACDANTPCVSTATCDSTCKVNVGATGCSADLPCVTGATCEGGTCKIKVAQTCVSGSSPHNCILHAECPDSGDNLNKCTCENDYTANTLKTVCEANAGEACDANTPCVSTATCDSTCKVNVGATGCSADLPCVTGATCEGGTCKIKVAQTCVSGSSPHNCILHAECPDSGDNLNKCTCENDYTANTLKTVCVADAVAGESCDDKPCVSSATCVTTGETSICKTQVTKAGDACPTLTTFCDSATLTCDGGLCKVQAGESCAATLATQCTAHADCTEDKCVCSATDFTSNTLTGVCEGTKDKGAPCANDNCKPGLVCDGGTCKTKLKEAGNDCSATATDKACDPTTLACQDGKCKWKIEQVCTATDQCVAGATCEGSGTTKQCSCPVGVSPSSDKAQCGGAMGIATSMLLVVATFVTSRFL
ncbi:prion-like-(Q/N-rich) domain-bearing protein 25 [Littorina saxatilis]|uniref:prion-like-(Q/N-rich) domain-bearing protein 25 n=1 Tax=Littorina saxatilis TaxID=31220 RepID=UPI0038B6523D